MSGGAGGGAGRGEAGRAAGALGAVAGAAGFARSLALYYGQPWKGRALGRLYGDLLKPGMRAFDIGAHVGHRTRILAGLGLDVVAVEPQARFESFLRRHLHGGRITVVRAAVGARPGEADLAVSSRHPTVSTLSESWRETVSGDASFAGVTWDRRERVAVTTLDALAAAHGRPDFCKIDVEGMEAEILKGLSFAVPLVSVEFLPQAPEVARACLDELARLGDYSFNAVRGETHRLVSPTWVPAREAKDFLARLCEGPREGDLYARLAG